MEKPVIMELIGDVKGKKVLDLGCGDAEFGLELIEQGCYFYEGVEGSINMVNKAGSVLRECRPRIENFKNQEEYMRRMRIPLILLFSCIK